jgi:hypothetical protein
MYHATFQIIINEHQNNPSMVQIPNALSAESIREKKGRALVSALFLFRLFPAIGWG